MRDAFRVIERWSATVATVLEVIKTGFKVLQTGVLLLAAAWANSFKAMLEVMQPVAKFFGADLTNGIRTATFLTEDLFAAAQKGAAELKETMSNIASGDTAGKRLLDGIAKARAASLEAAKAIDKARKPSAAGLAEEFARRLKKTGGLFSGVFSGAAKGLKGALGTVQLPKVDKLQIAGPPGALERGSAAAFSAANANRMAQSQLAIMQQQKTIQKQSADTLQLILKALNPVKPATL